MKLRLMGIILIVVMVVSGVQWAGAAPRPTIITFESSLASIALADAEAGTQSTTLRWHTAGMTEGYRLLLHAYKLDRWQMVYSEASVPLEPSGSRVVTVQHPLNFAPPTFLLSIVSTATNTIVDQRIVTIPYAPAAGDAAITAFEVDADTVIEAEALAASSVQIMVSWAVENRPPTANLVFEQVFEDDTTTSVELPRLELWIPSEGEGPVAPIYREGEDVVTLQVRLVDQVDGTVYAEETLELPLETDAGEDDGDDAGDENGADEDDGDDTGDDDSADEPQVPVEPGAIASFSATPDTVNPGAAVTLAWEINGTGGVTIQQLIPNISQAETVVTAQSPKGSAEVYLPDIALYSVTYRLTAASGTATEDVTVNVHCPYTFFFGSADGCPAGEARTVGVTYQEFENGYMLWRSDTNEIIVHYSDGTAAYFLEQDYAGLEMPELEEMPPLDRKAPGSGFGKVWANAPGVQAKLGWAVGEEIGYDTTFQRVAQTRSPRPEFAFFITLPDGRVAGSGYGAWRVMS